MKYPNPGAIHELGVKEKAKLERARATIARILGGQDDEIIFTSGASESNNLAILGIVQNFKRNFILPHIVTTNIEHASVLEVFKYLAKTKKAQVTFLKVEKNGILNPKEVKKVLKKNTILVSVMYANNEIGTIQPVREIAKEIRHYNKINSKKIIFHTDATQAVNYLPINIKRLGVDLLSFNAAKIYGPKGTGALFKKREISLVPIMHGGGQEFGLRPGTENVLGAVSLARALKITEKIKEKESKRLATFRDYFIGELSNSKILTNYRIVINGDLKSRLPNNINISIPGIPSDLLVLELSARRIYVSEKSACQSGSIEASHVIKAIRPKQGSTLSETLSEIDGSLRFSLGRQTTKKDIDYTLKALSEILTKLKKWYN